MALPDNFSPSEHLQDTVRRYLNPEVRDWFSDLGGDEYDPDITSRRGTLRIACTHLDSDSMTMTHIRMSLFDQLVRGRIASSVTSSDTTRYSTQVLRRMRPQIELYFMEDLGDVEEGFAPVDGRISFRLMQHTADSITEPVARSFAVECRSNFGQGTGYVWRKGKEMCSYSDWDKGYQLQLLCRSESVGRELTQRVLSIQDDVPDFANFNHKVNAEPSQAFPVIPPIERVYGQQRRLPRRRPVADVRFQYAVLRVPGLPNPVTLFDRSGVLANPLVD